VEKFEQVARDNVAALAAEVRAGRDVVVAQPTCAYVIKKDYPIYAASPEADLVAAHTFDPAEYLVSRHRNGEDTFTVAGEFPGRADGTVPDAVTYHVACHLVAQNAGLKGRDLLKLAGVTCTLVQRCSGIDGTWGYRAENYELARKVAAPLAREITAAGHDVVCGDCHLANGAIRQETGTSPTHPIQLMARAYGLADDA
jgi:Fe-S oxidoreductase